MKFEKKYISSRYPVVIIVAILVALAIIGRTLYTMTIDKERWINMGKVFVDDSLAVKPNRGNILSSDGLLMASSLPDFKIHLDFLSGGAKGDTAIYNKKDTLFHEYLDSISEGLHNIVPEWSAKRFKDHLEKGWRKRSQYYDVIPGRRLSYNEYKELLTLPMFNLPSRNASGLIVEERNNRKKPFGSLAKRMLGEMYGAKDSARSGLELAYDTLLRGIPGRKHRKKVLNKYTDIIDKEPIDGYDLVTTIDVSMQDICESALRSKMYELNASMGVVVLMEVETGDIKAIVNLQQYDDGNYYEARNYALASLMEPGSIFKTASLLVALDDGVITKDSKVHVGGGVLKMHGSLMKDHNWTRGGYNRPLNVTEIMMYSSNVGTSVLIDNAYGNNPQKFVDGLERIGIGASLELPFSGMADPRIRQPKSRHWSKTSLAWMSIGYENQIPPISSVAFYNAIANNGKMVKPRFVKGVMRDGEMVKEFPVEVLKEKICGDKALKDMQEMLKAVTTHKNGTGKQANGKRIKVAGKTGTAQVSKGASGYKSGAMEYLVSFCGYFPLDDPKYSCIVTMRKPNYPASGGGHAGPVFSAIADRVFLKNMSEDLSSARDSISSHMPMVKTGNHAAATAVLNDLGVASRVLHADSMWQTATEYGNRIEFQPVTDDKEAVPDVRGMGARDAVYALESRGVKVQISGYGKVSSQSIAPGTIIIGGQTIKLELN